MSADLFIGVDIGTQGTKAAVYDAHGACVAEAFRTSLLLRPEPGAVEEDPERQVDSVCQTLRECTARVEGRGTVRGLAVDGQMAGVIGVDEAGRAVTPYDSWLDTRCAPFIREMERKAGRRIVEAAGGPPGLNHGPKILWWRERRPEAWKRIRSFVQPGGYAAMRLCGRDGTAAFIDGTYLHFSGFADNEAGAWDPGLCAAFGVDVGILPAILASHDVVGGVSAAMAPRCGLPEGTPVVAGCGDTAASFLSCGATRPGVCVDVAGTASVFAGTTARFRPDAASLTLSCGRSAVPGLWHPYAYVNGGGMNLEWFRSLFGAGATVHGSAPASFDALNEAASALSPADDDPFFIPHLAGRASPCRPGLRGAWAGLDWRHGAAHLYRAVLEGVALEYGIYLELIRSLHPEEEVREVRVIGGGEKSGVWNRIKADVLGVPVARMAGAGGAPLGSALLAAYGTGGVGDLAEAAREWCAPGPVTEPDPARAGLYGGRLRRYKTLLASLEGWSVEGREEK